MIADSEPTPDIDVLVRGIEDGIEELSALVPRPYHPDTIEARK